MLRTKKRETKSYRLNIRLEPELGALLEQVC